MLQNYSGMVSKMHQKLQSGADMSIKLPYLHNHLDKFPNNQGYYSEEQREWFHQDDKTM